MANKQNLRETCMKQKKLIKNLGEEIDAKNKEIAEKDKQISMKDKEIAEKDEEISKLKLSLIGQHGKLWRMEEVLARFPHLGQQIFEQLGSKTQTKCLQISREWQKFMKNENITTLRMIMDYTKCSKSKLKKLLCQNDLTTLAKDVGFVYNPKNISCFAWTPFHSAAYCGKLGVCELIIENIEDKSPQSDIWDTPLHAAAQMGRLEVCKLILQHVMDNNPRNYVGDTPLHLSAWKGHLEVHEFLMDNVVDKNPLNDFSRTPLDYAKEFGQTALCELIKSKI